jgi:hypothetical protein
MEDEIRGFSHQTSNTCPSCGKQWIDKVVTPGIIHRTKLCDACMVKKNGNKMATPTDRRIR